MAHAPEGPQLYVCGECYVVHGGRHTDGGQFEAPEHCGACSSGELDELGSRSKQDTN